MAEREAEFTLSPRSVFDAVGGCRTEAPGVVFDEAAPRALVSLAARRGGAEALTATVEKATGLILPPGGRSAFAEFGGGGVLALFSGPGQWLLSAERAGLLGEMRELAGDEGSVTDQSDAFTALTLNGLGARAVLCRLSTLDFDDAAFPPGSAARTPMQQISVIVARREDEPRGAPRFLLNTPRSTARGFARDVETAMRALEARAAI